MHIIPDVDGQIVEEQTVLATMYAHLDNELAARIAALDRESSGAVDGLNDLYVRDVEISRQARNIRRLQDAESGLCFGRLDVVGRDGAYTETLYIGRTGLDGDSGDALLIDWRADAARPFYAATLARPDGVHRRRHIQVSNRTVSSLSDEILDGSTPTSVDIIQDTPLASALAQARTGRMRQATSTLQAEQDDIVRSHHRGVTVVDGGPGTGKTIVALHRAAYVLYTFTSVAESGLLVFGPNHRFLSYISGVLPSLGENDVRLATTSDIVGVDPTWVEPDHISRWKGSAAMADVLRLQVHRNQPGGGRFNAVHDRR